MLSLWIILWFIWTYFHFYEKKYQPIKFTHSMGFASLSCRKYFKENSVKTLQNNGISWLPNKTPLSYEVNKLIHLLQRQERPRSSFIQLIVKFPAFYVHGKQLIFPFSSCLCFMPSDHSLSVRYLHSTFHHQRSIQKTWSTI